MARRIRAVQIRDKTKLVQVWGIEELKNVDTRDTGYEFEIETQYHPREKAIQLFFHLKYEIPVKFNLVLGYEAQKFTIEYLIEGCSLVLIYNQPGDNPKIDVQNISEHSNVYSGTTIISLPQNVIKDLIMYKKMNE